MHHKHHTPLFSATKSVASFALRPVATESARLADLEDTNATPDVKFGPPALAPEEKDLLAKAFDPECSEVETNWEAVDPFDAPPPE